MDSILRLVLQTMDMEMMLNIMIKKQQIELLMGCGFKYHRSHCCITVSLFVKGFVMNENSSKVSIKSLLAEGSMQGLINAERERMQMEEAKNRAIQVAKKIQAQVQTLRDFRAAEKREKAKLKEMMTAVELYESSGDLEVLRKVKLL